MNGREPHQALKHEELAKETSRHAKCFLVRLQWGKDDFGYSLHVDPSGYSLSGYQITDFLNQLGLQHSGCPFTGSNQCFVKWVEKDFDLKLFTQSLDAAFDGLAAAQRELEKCGFFFDQPEGWGYFTGTSHGGSSGYDDNYYGDGHTALESRLLKESSDSVFTYKFTWIKNSEDDKGWIIHYRLHHPDQSRELTGAFSFLKIKSFEQCPEFEFESCGWRSIAFAPGGGRDPFDGNTNMAHQWFDAHSTSFMKGVQSLLEANALIEKMGFSFLPFETQERRLDADIKKRITATSSKKDSSSGATPSPLTGEFDVAISFAGTEREYAEKLANLLRDAGYRVFYDNFYPEDLWGKDLPATFDRIYRKQSRYCVMFISKEYAERIWTIHERKSAIARSVKDGGQEYILPIKVDGTDIDGLAPTIGHVALSTGIENIADLLMKKIEKNKSQN